MSSGQVYRDRDVDKSTGPSARAVLAAAARRLAAPLSPRRSPIRGGKNAIRPANTIYRGVRIALLNKYFGTLITRRLYRVTLHFTLYLHAAHSLFRTSVRCE